MPRTLPVAGSAEQGSCGVAFSAQGRGVVRSGQRDAGQRFLPFRGRRNGESRAAQVTAGNRLKSTGTARSAILAVSRTGPSRYRDGGEQTNLTGRVNKPSGASRKRRGRAELTDPADGNRPILPWNVPVGGEVGCQVTSVCTARAWIYRHRGEPSQPTVARLGARSYLTVERSR